MAQEIVERGSIYPSQGSQLRDIISCLFNTSRNIEDGVGKKLLFFEHFQKLIKGEARYELYETAFPGFISDVISCLQYTV